MSPLCRGERAGPPASPWMSPEPKKSYRKFNFSRPFCFLDSITIKEAAGSAPVLDMAFTSVVVSSDVGCL